MAKIDVIEIPTLLMDEQGSDPSTPAAGLWRMYTKSDGLYLRSPAGTVIGPLAEDAGSPTAAMQAICTHQGTTSITTGSVVAVPFGDTDERDTNSIHNPSSNNTRFTVPAGGAGVWAVQWKIFMAGGTTGAGDVGWGLQSYIRKNGTTDVDPRMRARTVTDADTTDAWGYRELVLADADYIEIMGTQASGGTATIGHASTASAKHYISFRRVGPS